MAKSSPPRSTQRVRLIPGERWFIAGKTGSGKSVYTRRILRAYSARGWPVLIVDPGRKWVETTGADAWAERPELSTIDKPYPNRTGHFLEACPVQLYEPELPGWKDAVLEGIFAEVMARGNVVVACDDVWAIADSFHSLYSMRRIWTEGRKVKVTALAISQKMVGIPSWILDNSENVVVFRLTRPSDLALAAEVTGTAQVGEKPLPRYWHWFYNEREDYATLMAPIPNEEAR